MSRQPDIAPTADMLATVEGICRYAARLGITLFVDEDGKSRATGWERADGALKEAITQHREALRAYKIRRRDEQIAEQRQMWAAGDPQKE